MKIALKALAIPFLLLAAAGMWLLEKLLWLFALLGRFIIRHVVWVFVLFTFLYVLTFALNVRQSDFGWDMFRVVFNQLVLTLLVCWIGSDNYDKKQAAK